MAYSYVEYTGTGGGTTGPFAYSMDLLDGDVTPIEDQLSVYKNGVLLVITTNYTIDTGLAQVTLVAPLFNTDTLRIARETKKDARYIDYEDSTNITSDILDLDADQLFFICQEAIDLQTDAMVQNSGGQWEGRSKRIENLATAVAGTDAVNYNQLLAATSGALPATLTGYGSQTYAGDSSTTSFTLPAAVSTLTEAEDLEVYINGVRQLPTTHYSLSAGNLVFVVAPLTGDTILIAFPQGVVSALLTANSVNTAALQPDCVTVAKIAPGSNGQVLRTDAGEPAWGAVAATEVTGFDTQVRTNRLDQMAAPTSPVAMGGQRINGLGTPTGVDHAATKAYVDAVRATICSTHTSTGTGSGTSINFSAVAAFQVGMFTLTIPYLQSGDTKYFTVSGVVTGTDNASDPYNTFLADADDASGGNVYSVYYTRSGAGNTNMAFTVTQSATSGVGNAMTLSTVTAVKIHLVYGSA